jgi:SAM-dependent methyltransferase
MMDFLCNVCGAVVHDCPMEKIDREIPSCPRCGSTVRFRSIVHLLSVALFGRSMALPQFPTDKNMVGLGMSDWGGYALPLADKLAYTNTFFHREPFYDVAIGDKARSGTCNFVIATEVFEHVCPPVERAFTNAFDLLKPGGYFVFTVPWSTKAATVEHFPELCDYRLVRFDDDIILVNRSKDGRYELHKDLIFHRGDGEMLEMREFCRLALEDHLVRTGFTNVSIMTEDMPDFGIVHKHPWSLPIVATRPQ